MDFTIKNYRCFSDEDPARFTLAPGVGAFVGMNNAGKSTLLRFFYVFRGLFEALTSDQTLMDLAHGAAVNFTPPQNPSNLADTFANFNDRDITISISNIDLNEDSPPESVTGIEVTIPRADNNLRGSLILSSGPLEVNDAYLKGPRSAIIHPRSRETIADTSVLIQAMRDCASTLYVAAFRNILNKGTNESYYDIQTGQAFVEQWRQRKTGDNRTESLAVLQVTSDIAEIFGLDDLEINAAASGTTLQVIVNGKPYMLPELGSGLAQFILVFANAAIAKPAFILIDEPELNLHPSLQLDFLTTLGTYARSGLLYATHSLGLALSAADRVYSVRNDTAGYSSVRPFDATPNLAEFSGEMSFSAYKDVGFEQILLVEGPTDARAILQFLRPLRKAHQVLLLPLHGSSGISPKAEPQLTEIKRITNHVKVLIDSEKQAEDEQLESGRRKFVAICKKLGIECHVLERRATENYFTDRAVKAAKGDNFQALGHYEKLSDASPSWTKAANWQIAAKMTLDELGDTDLGQFLASL